MSKPTLPTELLEEILSHGLKQNELALISRCSKPFSTIAKPLLYRSILIQSWRQVDQFRFSAREEDVREVKRVKIVGKGDPWELDKLVDVRVGFGVGDGHVLEKEAGCVQELIEGGLVNPDQVESIYIRNVLEDPNVLWASEFRVVPSTFANLKDVSIITHRGGLNVVTGLLKRENLPKLERLVIYEVTRADPGEGPAQGSDFPLLTMTSDLRNPVIERDLSDVDSLGNLLENGCDLLDELKIVVSPSFKSPQKKYPNLLRLTVLSQEHTLHRADKYAIVYTSNRSSARSEIDSVFRKLSRIVHAFSRYSLEYLAFPPGFKDGLLPPQAKILDDLLSLGVEIHFDGELGRSMAPPSFFDHLKRKREEEDKPTTEFTSA
ncbi:uncharacterized protein JCM6883_006906 [Sporobolomyces salmoneus]|uniref:uncharacterized protein n=1 Tax=Sporobolomyces salmoneus TaxID=183962 RepID=UPI003179CD51